MSVLRPVSPKPYGVVYSEIRNAGRSEKYRMEHDRIFKRGRKKSATGICKIIYRDGKRFELTTQAELDAFEAKYGKIAMRKWEI